MSAADLLRPMHWSDIEAALLLEERLFPHDAWSREQFWSELAGVPASRRYVVAEDESQLLGYAGVYALPGADADVQTIAVAPEQHRRGIGSALLADLRRHSAELGCPWLFLEVAADNEGALEFYRQHGFGEISKRRDYYGPGVAAVIMRVRP